MTDVFDRATEIEEMQREDALAEQRRRTGHGPAAFECEDCGVDIPEDRRQAAPGATRCIDCQRLREQIDRSRR